MKLNLHRKFQMYVKHKYIYIYIYRKKKKKKKKFFKKNFLKKKK